MDSSLARMMPTALGHSAQTDAFQGGREAAQTAKSQLPEGKFEFALALGPNSSDLQDFLEGVRLVAGDNGLIGFPSGSLITNDFFLPEGRLVCLLQSENMHVSLAATSRQEKSSLLALTSILTQHRRQRGNASHQFEHRGLILIDNSNIETPDALLQQATVEFGLDGWILLMRPMNTLPLPLFCRDLVLPKGLIGIEFLSQNPMGLGSVGLGAFDRTPSLIKEAAKAALREARAHPHGPFGLGFLLFDFDIDNHIAADLQMEFKKSDSSLKDIPWVAFRVAAHGVKFQFQSGRVQQQSITAVLMPS